MTTVVPATHPDARSGSEVAGARFDPGVPRVPGVPGAQEPFGAPGDESTPRVAKHRMRRFVLMMVALVVFAGWQAMQARAEGADDLRGDVPAGDQLRAEQDEIANERDSVLAELASAESDLIDVIDARDSFDEAQRQLAGEIESAIEHLRQVAVESFIAGEVGSLEYLAAVAGASEFSWRQQLMRSHAASSHEAVENLQTLKDQADDAVLESIEAAEELRSTMIALGSELAELRDRDHEVSELLVLADAWDRAAIAIEQGRWGIAPADKWAKLRACESTNNYQAVSPSGLYRGAYQFDRETWKTVGGSGDPAAAAPEEQDARARELYARRGPQPWPVCGRHLS